MSRIRLMFLLLVTIFLTPSAVAFHPPAASVLLREGRQTAELPKGQIVERLECLSDASQSYALYLPSNYTPERKWPILYAFDPIARGKSPVEKFKDAAEKYGWIVVGSNNSRNGPLPPTVDAWNAMSNDTHSRFAIDDARVYLVGLSGGARVAIRIATLCHDCAAGVIASAAGFPVGVVPSSSMHFAFFGTTGVDDFNFPELRSLAGPLAKAGIKHRIQVFDGRHEWAPPPVATAAVQWMELQAMKSGKRKRDEALVNDLWQERLQEARALTDAGRAYDAYLDLTESFAGLRDVGEIEKKVEQLRDSREVKGAIREEQRQITKQRDIETQIGSLIAARERKRDAEDRGRDVAGDSGLDPGLLLQTTLSALRKQSKAPEDNGDRRVARRTLDGLYIGLFEQGINSLQTEKRYDDAVRTFSLVTEVNPDRSGGYFYLAWAHAANGDKKKSLQTLKTAIEKGFSDRVLLDSTRAFDSMRGDPQYQQLIREIKN